LGNFRGSQISKAYLKQYVDETADRMGERKYRQKKEKERDS
jgi:hypothetical protein